MQNTRTIKTKLYLSIGAMFGVFSILYLLMFIEVPEDNRTIFDTSYGMIIGGTVVSVYNYFFTNNEDVLKEPPSAETEINE